MTVAISSAIHPSPTHMPERAVSTLTPTPLPTLPIGNVTDFFRDLVKTNGGCELPCFYGGKIVPGEMTAESATAFLASMNGNADMANGFAGVDIVDPSRSGGSFYHVQLTLTRTNGLVQDIQLWGDTWGYEAPLFAEDWGIHYGWDRILTQNGVPSEIEAIFFRSGAGRSAYYGIVLNYEDAGMFIGYQGTAQNLGQSQVQACLRFDDVNRIILRLVSQDSSMIESTGTPSGPELPTLFEQTGLSNEEFYQTFKNPGASRCLTSSETKIR